jgi:hypothetical protein
MFCIKMYKKVVLPLMFLALFTCQADGQTDSAHEGTFMRWEGSVSSGPFADLFYANIAFGGDDSDPPSYKNIPGKRVELGKVDRLEVKYYFNRKSAVSLNFNNALWKDLYGTGSDPLELWTETRRYNRRIQFAANYYRNFYTRKSSFCLGLGFLVQGEQVSFPFYRISSEDSTLIMTMDAWDRSYFMDWGPQLTASYYYSINPNLKIGLSFYTLYDIGTGVDGAGLMGSIAIPFHKAKKK